MDSGSQSNNLFFICFKSRPVMQDRWKTLSNFKCLNVSEASFILFFTEIQITLDLICIHF